MITEKIEQMGLTNFNDAFVEKIVETMTAFGVKLKRFAYSVLPNGSFGQAEFDKALKVGQHYVLSSYSNFFRI